MRFLRGAVHLAVASGAMSAGIRVGEGLYEQLSTPEGRAEAKKTAEKAGGKALDVVKQGATSLKAKVVDAAAPKPSSKKKKKKKK